MIIILVLFFASLSFGECVQNTENPWHTYNAWGQWCLSAPNCGPSTSSNRCCDDASAGEYCSPKRTYYNGAYYYGVVSEKSSPISGCTYSQFCSNTCGRGFMGNSIQIRYEWRCTSQEEIDSLLNSLTVKDTICLNIPASIAAQLGTGARAYYEKDEDGNLKKILNAENAADLCRRAIAQGEGEVQWLDNLMGPDGENYGSFCVGSCESQNIDNGGVTSCNEFGCRGTEAEGVNPNDYTAGSGTGGAFGGGTGGGFGSGGGGGAGGESGAIGDSLYKDTSEVPVDFGSGCKIFDPILCNCDDYVYTGNSGGRAHLYNHRTGLTGSCAIDYLPEYPSCPVDFNNCSFPKTLNDTNFTPPDSVFFDTASGITQLNYFPILNDINSSIKALDFNQNNNAKSMQDFFNNYTGTAFGSNKADTTIINITSKDTTIVNLPEGSVDYDFIYDSIGGWKSSINKIRDTLSSFSFFNPDSSSYIEIDTSGSVGRIVTIASSIIDSGKINFPFNLQSFSGQNNCPAFMMQGREIKTYIGSSHSFNYSSVCDVRIFGKELFALIRTALRLLISISCAWIIFKASVNFRED